MDWKQRLSMAKEFTSNSFMQRQLLLSSIIGPVQKRIQGNDGEYIMDADWDNLIILDGCRFDLFNEVYVKNDLEGELTQFRSRGSSSSEFLEENFKGRRYNDTVYVTANPHEQRVLEQTFYYTDRVWTDGWNDEEGIVLPEVLSERALAAQESHPNKRLIAHFMQPHAPFIGETRLDIDGKMMGGFRDMMLDNIGDINLETVWEALATGKVDKETFWEAYRDNLIYVLEKAIPLAEELPGKSVITADHGNALGERATPFPIPVYFHPSNIRIPCLNHVPWFVPPYSERKMIMRSGKEISRQASTENNDVDETTIDDRLSALGYR